MKTFQHVQICDISLIKKQYMTHGVYTNTSGKDWITNLLAKQIKEVFNTQQTTLIQLPWKKRDSSRTQECISWLSSGTLPALRGLMQENMDHQPANNTETLKCDIMCADSVTLFSERTTVHLLLTNILCNILS